MTRTFKQWTGWRRFFSFNEYFYIHRRRVRQVFKSASLRCEHEIHVDPEPANAATVVQDLHLAVFIFTPYFSFSFCPGWCLQLALHWRLALDKSPQTRNPVTVKRLTLPHTANCLEHTRVRNLVFALLAEVPNALRHRILKP